MQVGLVRVLGLDLGTTLILTGLYNIASGALFGIPMPVQVPCFIHPPALTCACPSCGYKSFSPSQVLVLSGLRDCVCM